MFKSWGEFREVRCPYWDICDLPYCQFGHDSGADYNGSSLIELVENEIERIESESRENRATTNGATAEGGSSGQNIQNDHEYQEIEQPDLISDPVEARVNSLKYYIK